MARRTGVVAALLFTLALSTSFLWPARAAATGTYEQVSSWFSTSSMPLNGTATLEIKVQGSFRLTGISVTDTLPLGLVIAAVPNVTVGVWYTTGTVTAVPGSSTISLTGFGDPDVQAGNVLVNVTGTIPGLKTDSLTSTSDQGGPNRVLDGSIDVVAPPVVSAAFTPATLAAAGDDTTVTYTVTNPSDNDVPLTNVGFTATLPSGMSILYITPGCPTIVGNETTQTLSNATVGVRSSCSFALLLEPSAAGYYVTSMSAPTSDNGGTGVAATAGIGVGYAPPAISSAFAAPSIVVGGSTTLSFTVTNPNHDVQFDVQPAAGGLMTLSGIGFTDTLPAGLVVATPNGLAGSCGGGTITAPAGGTTIALAGATLVAGASCTFSVVVVAVSPGSFTDSTGPIGSTEGGSGSAGSAGLTVVGAPATTPTLAATPPPTSVAAPSSSGDGAGFLLPLLLGMAAAACLAWRMRMRPRFERR